MLFRSDSTMAYQYYGYNKRVKKETLENLYDVAVGDFKPDLTIILDLDPEIGLGRSMGKAKNMAVKELRHESRGLEFHKNLRNGFLEIAKTDKNRYIVLDANKSINDLHVEVINAICEKFGIN